MIWKKAKIYKAVTEPDKLGNEVTVGYSLLVESYIRFSPWAKDDVELEGREVTENQQRYLIPVDYTLIYDATHIEIDGHIVEITSLTDNTPRWTVAQIRKWKV